MKITNLWEIETESSEATGEEIATLLVNAQRGHKLRELKVVNNKIIFIFEEKYKEESHE